MSECNEEVCECCETVIVIYSTEVYFCANMSECHEEVCECCESEAQCDKLCINLASAQHLHNICATSAQHLHKESRFSL